MAMETRGKNLPEKDDIPKGHRAFRVVTTTICDSTDTYCAKGEWAVLNKKDAEHYLDLSMIRVELPEDFDDGPVALGKAADTTDSDKSQAKP